MKYLTADDLKKIAGKYKGKLTISGSFASISWKIKGRKIGFSNNAIMANLHSEMRFADFCEWHDIPDSTYKNYEPLIALLPLSQAEEELNDIPKVLIVLDEGIIDEIRSTLPVNARVVEFDDNYPSKDDYQSWEDLKPYERAERFETLEEMEEDLKERFETALIENESFDFDNN